MMTVSPRSSRVALTDRAPAGDPDVSQDVVGSAVDARVVLELADEELAQRTIALRPAAEAVGRERRPSRV
jgi:hypothetical protein